MAIRARYKGNGNEHINGVPMRDLDEDDWGLLDSEQRATVRATKRADGKPLYDVATDKEMGGSKKAPAATAHESETLNIGAMDSGAVMPQPTQEGG